MSAQDTLAAPDSAAAIEEQTNAAIAQGGGGADDVQFNPSNEGAAPSPRGESLASQQAPGGVEGGGVAGSSGLAGQPGAAQPGAATDWESVLDVARSYGYDPGAATDEREFLKDVLTRAHQSREADYYSQLGRQLAPHYQGIQEYLGKQKAAPAAPEAAPEWKAPEFDQGWMNLVQRDERTGVFLARPGVNPVVADKVNQYDKWYQKYGTNPAAVMQPMLQETLPKMLGEMLDERLGQYQRQQTINQIVATNSAWMYQSDGTSGRPTIGVNGQPVATAEGARYIQLVGQLEHSGIRDPITSDSIARQLLLGEMARGQVQRQNGAAPAAQQQAAIASGRSQTNVNQSRSPQERAANGAATEPDSTGMSLTEMLRRDFDAAGFSEADFSNLDFLTGGAG